MSDLSATAVIRGHPDGYDMSKPALMGRQAAGHGFLRAAIAARGGRPIVGYSPSAHVAKSFEGLVQAIDPTATFEAILPTELPRIGRTGVLYLADSTVATHARARFRHGMASFSLCGVTHTTASQLAMNEIAGLLPDPVAPWDALICTSNAVLETIRRVHEAELDYLRWRLGDAVKATRPQLPVIPLGVHCDDFAFTADQRGRARTALGLDPDEVAALFVGRLVYHAKAHPHAMYRGLQAAAERTGKRVALILCGWAPNEGMADVFRSGAAQFAPDVRLINVEGRDLPRRDEAWAASDLFVSLSDNIQETFGLTPIEAMAAGLPLVVTDWNGYKDTVRDGVDGFRVATWAPSPGMGLPLATAHENGALNYDRYCWAAGATTAVDFGHLTDALSALVASPAMRRTMGEAGRARARELYDWPVVYRQYQALWADLNARRKANLANAPARQYLAAAPSSLATNIDPYQAFGHYPTQVIAASTVAALSGPTGPTDLAACLAHPLFANLPNPPDQLHRIAAALRNADATAADLAQSLDLPLPTLGRALGQLAKMGVVRLR